MSALKINNILYLYIAFVLLVIFRVIPNIVIIKSVILIVFSVIMILFIYRNKALWGMGLFGLGTLMNSLVMMLNNNRMPVSRELLMKIKDVDFFSYLETSTKHVMMDEFTRLYYLGDIIYVPYTSGEFLRIVSIGDIFIFIGMLVILISIIAKTVRTRTKSSVM